MPEKLSVSRPVSKPLQHYKLPFILLAAFLTMIALMALIRAPFSAEKVSEITILSQNSVYDLSKIPNLTQTVIHLMPSDVYYPSTYLTPENADRATPTSTEKLAALRADYLSQRFVLLLPEDAIYMLAFSLSGRHAMRVYANGKLVGQAGHPGATKQDTEVWENNITCTAESEGGKMDIILNSAQFYHAKHGASLAELSLSPAGLAADPFSVGRIKGLVVMGILFGTAALLLSIYLLLSHTVTTLYFVLACLVMALREVLQSQAWVYFPLNGNVSFMLEYLSLVLLTIFLSLYLGQYVTDRFSRSIQCAAIMGSLIYGGCLLFGDSLFYTAVLIYYQVLLVLCIVPGIGGVLWHMRHPTKEQAAALYGITVFYFAAISDILMYTDLLGDYPNAPVSEIAMLVFVLAQTVSLFLMNNRLLAEAQEAEQKLAAEKQSLESLNRMKTEFLGNVSHELKTPLTVMSGYAQSARQLALGQNIPDGEKISHRMTLIASEAERLSLMISQILDVTRMEEGRMAMTPARCFVDEIIHAAIETHYPMLNKNGNRLDIRIEGGLPAVSADPARIAQVIVNLISNAVRFTSNGLIIVSAKCDSGKIVVCVADNGQGIDHERMQYIFERYGGKQKSGGGSDTGTGLGLYICKHIVEQHGGSIWIESEAGKGTSVFFTLPVLKSVMPDSIESKS